MKKTWVVIPALVAGSFLMSCTQKQKVENAENNLVQANEELNKAKGDYVTEVENYRKETIERIRANERNAIEFKKRIENDKKDARADYNEKIAVLEIKNRDLRRKMNDYRATSKENWSSFKTEFNHDMDELGKAFNDLTVKNVKNK